MSRQFLVSSSTLSSSEVCYPSHAYAPSNFTFFSIVGMMKRPASSQALHGLHAMCCKAPLHLVLAERHWWPSSKQKSSTSLYLPHSDLDCVLLDSLCEWHVGHREDLNKVRLVFWWVVSNGKSPSLSVLLRWLSFKAARLIPSVIPEISRRVQF